MVGGVEDLRVEVGDFGVGADEVLVDSLVLVLAKHNIYLRDL